MTTDLHIVAHYELGGGIELEAPSESLLRLAELLRGGDAPQTVELTVPASRDARPYDGFLSQLRLATTPGPARIYRDGDTLEIHGSPAARETLAENVEFLAASPEESGAIQGQSRHIHVEYFDDHPFLAPEAEPLVIFLA